MIFWKEGEKCEWENTSGGCPDPGDIQGQAGWGSEQPDLAVGIPDYCSGFGLDDL